LRGAARLYYGCSHSEDVLGKANFGRKRIRYFYIAFCGSTRYFVTLDFNHWKKH